MPKRVARLEQDIRRVTSRGGDASGIANLLADPVARKTFAREMRHELQKQQTSRVHAAHLQARPFVVKCIELTEDGRRRRSFAGSYATIAEAEAHASRCGGWVESRIDGRVVWGNAE